MIYLYIFTSFLLFVLVFLLVFILVKRYKETEKYYILTVFPLKYNWDKIFIQKFSFFLMNCKSIPNVYWNHNLILDITNKDWNTNFNLIVPESYLKDYHDIFKSNYDDFQIKADKLISESEYFKLYKWWIVFRTTSETPFLREEIIEEKIWENIKSIVNWVNNGSFQIMLNFNAKSKTFVDSSQMDEVRIDNTLASSNINFVKDISANFRFLSFEESFTTTTMPWLVGWILNLWWKFNHVTKTYTQTSLKVRYTWLKESILDFFYRITYWNKLRFDRFSPSDWMLFNAKEISYLYNFIPTTKTSSLPYKSYSPQEALKFQETLKEQKGEENLTKVWLFDYPWVHEKHFFLDDSVLRRHTYLIWKTWTWKTTTLKVFINDDIKKWRWFAVLDPHWDVADEILDIIPDYRVDDVIYVDPSMYLWRVCLSIFSTLREIRHYQQEYEINQHKNSIEWGWDQNLYHMETEDKFMSMIVTMIKAVSVWGQNMWWPRMDKIMKEIGTSTLKYDISEISDISYYLNIPKYRDLFIKNIENLDIKESLNNFEEKPQKDREEAFQPVRNRFDVFLSDTMKNIFSWKPKFSLRDAMDSNKIIIFRLPKWSIWDGNSQLLWSMIVSMFWAMAQTRISIPENERKDFTLYIDEFQNFVTDSFSQILEEARKYRFRLVLANQFTKQIKHKNEAVFDSIKGNIWTFIALWLWSDDSTVLSKHFWIDAHDMANLPPYKWYVKCEQVSSTPFNIKMELTERDNTVSYPWASFIKTESYKKYWIDSEKYIETEQFVIKKDKISMFLSQQNNWFTKDIFTNSLKLQTIISDKLIEFLVLEGYLKQENEKYFKLDSLDKYESDFIEITYSEELHREKWYLSLSTYFRDTKRLPRFSFNHDWYSLELSKKMVNTSTDSSKRNKDISVSEIFSKPKKSKVSLFDTNKFEEVSDNWKSFYFYEIKWNDVNKTWWALAIELWFKTFDYLQINNQNNTLAIRSTWKITNKNVWEKITIRL